MMTHVPPSAAICSALLLGFAMLSGCSENEAPDDKLDPAKGPEIVRIVPAGEALAGAHIPTLHPSTLHEPEIRKVLGTSRRCDFRYTSTGKPVVAIGLPSGQTALNGVVKLNGHLVVLSSSSNFDSAKRTERFDMTADPVRIAVVPKQQEQGLDRLQARRQEANMIFEIGQSLRVGYGGYLECKSEASAE